MVLIVFGTLGILKVNLDLVRHLLIHVLAAKTGNDSYNTKAQGSPCNTPINLLVFFFSLSFLSVLGNLLNALPICFLNSSTNGSNNTFVEGFSQLGCSDQREKGTNLTMFNACFNGSSWNKTRGEFCHCAGEDGEIDSLGDYLMPLLARLLLRKTGAMPLT